MITLLTLDHNQLRVLVGVENDQRKPKIQSINVSVSVYKKKTLEGTATNLIF